MAGRNAVWALICDDTIMNIIDCLDGYEMANQLARVCYGDEAIAININQWLCGIGDIYRNGVFFHVDDEKKKEIPYVKLLTDEEELQALKIETAELKEVIHPTIDLEICTLDDLKEFRQKTNKAELTSFLQNNPILWTDGELYGVTKESQDEMIADKTAYDLKHKSGNTEWKLEWHNQKKARREFSEKEFMGLFNAIIDFVYPFRKLQEKYKEQIFSASTKEQVLAVKFNYSVELSGTEKGEATSEAL